MNRKQFVKSCGLACIGTSTLGLFMQSCIGTRSVRAELNGDQLMLLLEEFELGKKENKAYRKYVLAHNELLKFPICVFRISDDEYSALYLQCSHQGNELSVYGDKLQCPAHGSEFDTQGRVTNGPAEKSLRKFPVTVDEKYLYISLKSS